MQLLAKYTNPKDIFRHNKSRAKLKDLKTMNELKNRVYTGDGNCRYEPLKDVQLVPEPYIAPPRLAEAVNDALYLRRPLLLEGEPGCGKTRLAYAVAYELGYPLKECYIRSTSRAQDLLYTYDAVQRLYDIQENKTSDSQDKIRDRRDYVELGKLGEGIELSQKNIPSVVLIDEIDKADIDFPNDLLLVLDKLQFEVDEVKGWKFDALQGKTSEERRDFLPLIIITSNREKELPQAFLRRCLFYYIDFPQEEELTNIVTSHFQKAISPLFEEALKKFWKLRHQKSFPWRKKPSTSEFINWLRLLERDELKNKLTPKQLAEIDLSQLPYFDTIVKTQNDLNALDKLKGLK
jgi:MoxR-like ATPase